MEAELMRCSVKKFQSAEPLLRLNPSASHIVLGARPSEVECVHGERRLKIRCVIDHQLPENTIAVSRPAARALRLTEYNWQLPVGVSHRRLQFGPLIGILSNPRWDKETQTLKKNQQLEALQRLVKAGQEHGAVCFLFNLQGVDLGTGTVRGFVLHEDRWYRRTLPLPNVIYDQLVSRKLERDPTVQDKRQALSRRYGDKFFNNGFFDKWQVYEWLKEDDHVKPHLPKTIRHTSLSTATAFLKAHPVAFLKPLHGSLGLGIARFMTHRDRTVSYEIKQTTKSVLRGKASSIPSALSVFRTRLRNRPYIWQEGLTLATYNGRPVDVRILMQRDETGEWKRTKMFARVAKSGDFTSNLTGGGDAMPVDEALVECLPKTEMRARAKTQIRRLSNQVVEAVEAAAERKFGEMGIDLGLDVTGKVWVIEVNSKPRKAPSTEKGRQDLVDLSFERPIRYAIYLAKSTRN